MEESTFRHFSQLKQTFRSADYVPPYTVFDIRGNNYRIAALVHYETGKVAVKEVMTHSEYMKWSRRLR